MKSQCGGQTSFGKERLRKLTMSDMELRPAILIKICIHTTKRKGETGKRREEKERINRNFWDARQAMHKRQLTTVIASHLCLPVTSVICFLIRSIQFLLNMFMEGKWELLCSQNITMYPENPSPEMVSSMQRVQLRHYLIIKNGCYSLNIKTCHRFTPPRPGPAVPSILPCLFQAHSYCVLGSSPEPTLKKD